LQVKISAVVTINFLKCHTSQAWTEQAIANLDTILLDHSHCERKAASVAINFMFRYPSSTELVRKLTALAKEELEHFELVNQHLEKRGIPLGPLPPPPYGALLRGQVRPQEPYKMLDSLLVCSAIEARSHERLGLLAQWCPDLELADFYRVLMVSEARHYGVYWLLARTYFPADEVDHRLHEIAEVESQILANLHPEPRIHS